MDTSVSVTHALSKSVDKNIKKIRKYKILKNSQKYYLQNYMKCNVLTYGLIRLFYYLSLGISYLTFWI